MFCPEGYLRLGEGTLATSGLQPLCRKCLWPEKRPPPAPQNSEKKRKREKRNEIQRMILLKSSLVVFIWTQICLKKEIF